MSSYRSMTIREVVEKIGAGEIYLPAIQRRFVWNHSQIERLFDSILRDYPIGTFLFWDLKEENVNRYTFYKFLQEYHEQDSRNEIRPTAELKGSIIGVLDGQQRLSSMYLALQGSYAYKRKYAASRSEDAYPKRQLYLNLLYEPNEEDDFRYQFRFLTADEAETADVSQLWFDVRRVLSWGNDPDVDGYYDEVTENGSFPMDLQALLKEKPTRDIIKRTLRMLHQRIVLEDLINYYSIHEQDLDKILDIFVRVNSAGTILSKTDLLLSTIIANWPEGREKIEDLLAEINKTGDGFGFDTDFIMRTCLFVIDAPVLFKLESFNRSNVQVIIQNWDTLADGVRRAVELAAEFGFSRENLTASNALIPLVYYFCRGGVLTPAVKKELQLYLISALLKTIFRSSTEQVLNRLRTAMKATTDFTPAHPFDFSAFAREFNRNNSKSLTVTGEDIEELLEYKKSAYTFMVLSLLYPQLNLGQVKCHQEHIHPYAGFSVERLKKLGLDAEHIARWRDMRDKLPNLQLSEGTDSPAKGKTPLAQWLLSPQSSVEDPAVYKKTHFIDPDASEAFEDFPAFYAARRALLAEQLRTLFRVS